MDVVVSQLSLGKVLRRLCVSRILIGAIDDTSAPATQDTQDSVEPAAKRRRVHRKISPDPSDRLGAIVQQQRRLHTIAVNAMTAADKALVSSFISVSAYLSRVRQQAGLSTLKAATDHIKEQQQAFDWDTRFQRVEASMNSIRTDVAAAAQQVNELPGMVDQILETVKDTIAREVRQQIANNLPQLVQGILPSGLREPILGAVQPALQPLDTDPTDDAMSEDDDNVSDCNDTPHSSIEDTPEERLDEDTAMAQADSTPTPSDSAPAGVSLELSEEAAASMPARSPCQSSNVEMPVEQASVLKSSSKVISPISSYVQRAQGEFDEGTVDADAVSAPYILPEVPPATSLESVAPPPDPPTPTSTPPPLLASASPITLLSALTPLPSAITGPHETIALSSFSLPVQAEGTISTFSTLANASTSVVEQTGLAPSAVGDSISALLSHYNGSPTSTQNSTHEG